MKEDIEMIQLLNGGAYLVDGKQVIPAGGEAAAKLKAAAGVSPVSYTHLDVYKRQT